mgnify:CR=1 FL=1
MHGFERGPVVAFTGQETARWPRGLLAALVDGAILHETQLADSVWCDECEEGCSITPDVHEHPGTGELFAVHYCSKEGYGRITVSVDQMRQWQSDPDGMAKWLCAQLALASAPTSIVRGQLYLLGTRPTTNGPLDVFLAFGLSQASGYDVVVQNVERLRATPGSVIIMPAYMPVPGIWSILKANWLILTDLVLWDAERSVLDASMLVRAVQAACPAISNERWITVTEGARLLTNDLPYLDMKKAAARISKAAGAGKFMTNGKARDARRIDRTSFDAWRLEQRDRDLDAEEDD